MTSATVESLSEGSLPKEGTFTAGNTNCRRLGGGLLCSGTRWAARGAFFDQIPRGPSDKFDCRGVSDAGQVAHLALTL